MATPKLTAAELRAWQALLHAHHDVIELLDDELRDEHGLLLAEYDVLLRLARARGRSLRMSEIAQRVTTSPSGLTRLVDRLEAEGSVRREDDPEDGRWVRAVLTESGLQRLRAASRTHLRGVREHFTGRLTEAQLGAVAEALEAVTGPHALH